MGTFLSDGVGPAARLKDDSSPERWICHEQSLGGSTGGPGTPVAVRGGK
jgi:hypothetical protein